MTVHPPLLFHLLQPCPSSSPCCWRASTAAVTPGSTCVSPAICSRISGRTSCAAPPATSSRPLATASQTSTPVTRASLQTLPSRARAVRGASHRPPRHECLSLPSFLKGAHPALLPKPLPIRQVQLLQRTLTSARGGKWRMLLNFFLLLFTVRSIEK